MNTKSSRAEAKDRTGGGLPGWKQWSKPPLKASISVHIFRADENDFRQVVHNLSHHLPSVLFLHLSASCPTVINSPNWKRPYQTFRSNSLQSRNPWTANEFTCNFCLDTPMAGSSLWPSPFHGWAVLLSKFFLICHSATLHWFSSPQQPLSGILIILPHEASARRSFHIYPTSDTVS